MKTFLNGLSLILPTALVFYLLLWILEKTEIFFKDFLLLVVPENYYFPGMGLVAGFVFVYFIGLMLKFWIVQQFRNLVEKLINEMPILSSIYGGIKDFFNFFSNMKEKGDQISVLVDIPALDGKILGLITREDFSNFDDLDMEEPVLVYLQMSYQVGGYSLFIPKKNLTPVNMDIEDAIRFIMTAGVSDNHKGKKNG